MPTIPNLDMGVMIEGVVELDPMSGRLVLRYEAKDGSNDFVDVQERLLQYNGAKVRFILTPMSTVKRLAAMVESGGMKLEDVPKVPRLS
jgi:hypothetical protein